MKTEHKAVLDTMRELERQGFEVTYLDVAGQTACSTWSKLKAAIRPDTILVSVMFVNNEIGVIQDDRRDRRDLPREGHHLPRRRGAGDRQGRDRPGRSCKVDLMTFTAHKTYGPKGIGALYVRRKPRVRLEAQMHGGGHERGMRSGTLPTHQIVGMGEAFRIASEEMATENERIRALRDAPARRPAGHRRGLHQRRPGAPRAAQPEHQLQLRRGRVADHGRSRTSRCRRARPARRPAWSRRYVLRALGRSDELAHSSIRITIGRFTTEEDIDYAIDLLKDKVAKLRELSPLWEMYKDGIDISTIQWAAH